MSQAFTGQIMLFGGSFAPRNWHFCDGSILNVSQYQALFSLLGTQYGGNGSTTFGLPDLRGRVAVGQGAGTGLSPWTIGQKGGAENVTLTSAQMPTHSHNLVGNSGAGTTSVPGNNYLANAQDSTGTNAPIYATSQNNTNLGGSSIGPAGSGQGHTNIQPSIGLNYIICLNGIYPTRS